MQGNRPETCRSHGQDGFEPAIAVTRRRHRVNGFSWSKRHLCYGMTKLWCSRLDLSISLKGLLMPQKLLLSKPSCCTSPLQLFTPRYPPTFQAHQAPRCMPHVADQSCPTRDLKPPSYKLLHALFNRVCDDVHCHFWPRICLV